MSSFPPNTAFGPPVSISVKRDSYNAEASITPHAVNWSITE
jgi:hypothetical protein